MNERCFETALRTGPGSEPARIGLSTEERFMSVESNRLGQETSPYLLQHQHNPVHWQAWSAETLALAKRSGRPVLLSVGYAACHWCHVMAHESFENAEIAALMNEYFVNVKVDREERPDVDHLYQQALMMMGRRGGWPLTMFLTPDGQPFWGGTYFPPFAQGGKPGFAEVLQTIAELWRNRANAIEHNVKELGAGLANLCETTPGEPISSDLVEAICEQLVQRLDRVDGGFGAAPKFPQATSLDFLWRAWKRTGRDSLRQAVLLTLDHISQGGVYDHLGGGFARYSTDDRWLVPHFEKMLYDNAQLIELLTEVWQDERRELYRLRVTETIQWITREMRAPGGGFASSLDADSEGEEGKFYAWSEAEIREALGVRAPFFERAYGVDREGNWEHGKSVLNRLGSIELLDEETEAALARDRAVLFSLREGRVRPGCDDKVLADWNGLTIAAIAKASCVFERQDWLDVAIEAFHFVQSAMMTDDGRLFHSWREGRARHLAVLDDYAAMCRAALALHEATGAPSYLECGRRWLEQVEIHYRDRNGGYFFTADDAEALIARAKIAQDSALPSGNGMMLQVLAQLYHLTGESLYRQRSEGIANAFSGTIRQAVLGFSSLLNGMEALRELNAAALIFWEDYATTARRRLPPLQTVADAHVIVPNNAPTPAVTAIASAPQNVARIVPVATFAPPVRDAHPPKVARQTRDVADTKGMTSDRGTIAVTNRGTAAPTEKLMADAVAAWIGRALKVSEIPSSSRA